MARLASLALSYREVAGADPGGVPGAPRNPPNVLNVLLATICMSMYMCQLFSFDYTGTPL